MYASETWRLRKLEEKMITTWDRRILRRIFGPKREDGIWKIRINKELIEPFNNPDTVAENRSRRIACLGHLIRMAQGQMVKILFNEKPRGRRGGGRRLRWVDDAEADWRKTGKEDGGSQQKIERNGTAS
jgi:hypothetical protein